MTVASGPARYQFTGDGATASFAMPPIFVDPGDILVTLLDADGNQMTTVRNGAGTYDYTVVGTKDPATGEYLSGAQIVFNTAPPGGWFLTLYRDPPLTQNLALAIGGPLPPLSVNTALDALALEIQALRDRSNRSIKGPVTDPLFLTQQALMTLPSVSLLAGGILGFDSQGAPVIGGNLLELIALLDGSGDGVGGYLYARPASADTLTAPAHLGAYVIDPAGELAALTIVLPPAPVDGQLFEVSTTRTIDAFSATGGGGALGVLAAGGGIGWRYRDASLSWYRRF